MILSSKGLEAGMQTGHLHQWLCEKDSNSSVSFLVYKKFQESQSFFWLQNHTVIYIQLIIYQAFVTSLLCCHFMKLLLCGHA